MFRTVPILLVFLCSVAWAENNPILEALYEKDQADRKEVQNGGHVPDVKVDLGRRVMIFDMLLDGEIVTGEDYIRALIILQHTSLWFYTDDLLLSMSPENHLLALPTYESLGLMGEP